MVNIPTDLLRTLIAVIDLRSFTRAAHSFGVTQPAVSAQIRRLQMLLGGDLFDKSAPGVTLTTKGELVVGYARRLLALNDQMLDVTLHHDVSAQLRVGVLTDYFEGAVLRAVAMFGTRRPDLQMNIFTDRSDGLMRDLRRGDYDLVVSASDEKLANAVRSWLEPTAWAMAPSAVFEVGKPVPLVVLNESGLSHRMSVAALEEAGREYRIAYRGGSVAGMVEACAAGFGVVNFAKRYLLKTELKVFDSSPLLPRLPDVHGGVYLREGLEGSDLITLAEIIADAITGTAVDRTLGSLAAVT
jgi:DNA-binding transcriptional LysR family regulator